MTEDSDNEYGVKITLLDTAATNSTKYEYSIPVFPKYGFWIQTNVTSDDLNNNTDNATPGCTCFVTDGDNPGLYVRGLTKWNYVPGSGE